MLGTPSASTSSPSTAHKAKNNKTRTSSLVASTPPSSSKQLSESTYNAAVGLISLSGQSQCGVQSDSDSNVSAILLSFTFTQWQASKLKRSEISQTRGANIYWSGRPSSFTIIETHGLCFSQIDGWKGYTYV